MKSITQTIRRFIERLLMAAQRVPASRMQPSEPELRTTSLHELDRQSQPSQWGCHSQEVQDQPFAFCRQFGTASIFSTVFSMHSIGFLLRETEPEWKLAQNISRYYCTPLCKPKAVYSACEQWYTAAGGGVQVPRGGIYVWRKEERHKIDTRLGKAIAVVRELYHSVATKWELSNTAKLSVFK